MLDGNNDNLRTEFTIRGHYSYRIFKAKMDMISQKTK